MEYIDSVMFLLVLLAIKHCYIDFVDQTMTEVISKGIYGDPAGIGHSAKHGFATLMCILAVTGSQYFGYAMILAFFDFVVHYHVDWSKININKKYNYTPNDAKFWHWVGYDQLAHTLTYLVIARAIV